MLAFCVGAGLFSFWPLFVDKMVIVPLFLGGLSLILSESRIARVFAVGVVGSLLGWVYVSYWGLAPVFVDNQAQGVLTEIECSKKECRGILRAHGTNIKVLLPFLREPDSLLLGSELKVQGENSFRLKKREYLGQRISGVLRVSQWEIISRKASLFLRTKSFLYELKKKLEANLGEVMRNRYRVFAEGLVLGKRQEFSRDFRQALQRTGTTHLVALSGFNISILVFALFETLKIISPFLAFGFTTLSILGFVLMTGVSASVLRAGVMGILLLLARVLGRQRDSLLILSFSLFVMSLLNPFDLVWNPSLQLSFAAFVGLLAISPLLSPYLSFFGFLGIIAGETLGAITFTLPLVVYYFGTVSLVAILVNILIVAVVPITTYFILATAVIGFFSVFASQVFAYLAQGLLTYLLLVIEFFARFNWAAIEIGFSHAGWVWVYYLALGLALWGFWKRRWQIQLNHGTS